MLGALRIYNCKKRRECIISLDEKGELEAIKLHEKPFDDLCGSC